MTIYLHISNAGNSTPTWNIMRPDGYIYATQNSKQSPFHLKSFLRNCFGLEISHLFAIE